MDINEQTSKYKQTPLMAAAIQKDINMLEGKLSRTYTDVDHRLFEQAKRDKALIPTYRYFFLLLLGSY